MEKVVPLKAPLELIEMPTKRRFVGIEMICVRIPDEFTILALRHLLENHELCQQVFQIVKAHLKANSMAMNQGTIIDATLIAAPSSSKNKSNDRYHEMHLTKTVASGITASQRATPTG